MWQLRQIQQVTRQSTSVPAQSSIGSAAVSVVSEANLERSVSRFQALSPVAPNDDAGNAGMSASFASMNLGRLRN